MKIKLRGGGEFVVKTATCELLRAEEGKPLVAIVSTETVDSYGDIIHQGPSNKGAGWILDRFNRNPRIYWMHDPLRPNLAKASARVENNVLVLETLFDMKDAFAAEIDRKYREGFLSEWSVGFKPKTREPIGDGPFSGEHFWEQELVEVSSVNRGANPDTVTIGKMLLDNAEEIDDGDTEAVRLLKDELIDLREDFESRIRNIEATLMRGAREADERKASELELVRSRVGSLLKKVESLQ